MSIVFLATDSGQVVRATGLADASVSLAGKRMRALCAEGGRVWAGGAGMWRSDGAGVTWRSSGLAGRSVTAIGARGDLIVAGQSGGGISISTDAGKTWRDAPLRPAWWWRTPGPWPMTPHIQAIAISDAAIVAGVEVGGVHTSHDGGQTWTRGRGAILDCHGLAVDPCAPDHFWQAGAGSAAVARSVDAGQTWTKLAGTTAGRYGWAVATDEDGHAYVSSAAGPRFAHRGLDARASIDRLADDVVRIPRAWASMPYGLAFREGKLFAACADGGIHVSVDAGRTWTRVASVGTVGRAFAVTRAVD